MTQTVTAGATAAVGLSAATAAGRALGIAGQAVDQGTDTASLALVDAVAACYELTVDYEPVGHLLVAVERSESEPTTAQWTTIGQAATDAAAAGTALSAGPPEVGPPDAFFPRVNGAGHRPSVWSLQRGDQRVGAVVLLLEGADAAPADLPQLDGRDAKSGPARSLASLADVEMAVTVELGRTSLFVRDLLGLQTGAVIQLDQAVGSAVDVFVNGTRIGRGEIVVVDDDYGVRVTQLVGED